MANPCIYTFKGKEYFAAEFRAKLATEFYDEVLQKSEPPREIGISQEMRNKQLKELGLPEQKPLDKNVSEHTFEALNEKANKMVDSGEADPLQLAKEINEGKKDTDDLHNVILNRGTLDIDSKIRESNRALKSARENGDRLAEENAADEVMQAVADLRNIQKALSTKLTKAARELGSAKIAMKEDFSLGNLYKRFEKANADKPLSRELNERLADHAAKIADLYEQNKILETKIEGYKKDVDKVKNKAAAPKTIFNDWKTRDTRKAELKAKWAEASKSSLSSSIIGLNKEQIEIVGEMALLHIIDGVTKVGQLAVKLKRDFEELTPEQVKDLWENHKIGEKTIAEYAKDKADDKLRGKKVEAMMDELFPQEALQKEREKEFKKATEALVENNRELEKTKRRVNNEETAIEYAQKTNSEKAKQAVMEVLNTPRSLMASFDFSAPLRQGLVASAAHPISASKATKEMFRQAFSQENFDNWLIDYKQTPDYKLAEKSELYIANPADLHRGLEGKEEAFMSNLAEKIPYVGAGIRASERGYVGYLNKLRADVFKNGAEDLQKRGLTFEKNPEEFKAWADFVNNATGRGKLPLKALEDAAPILNSVFFSPRLIASRINTLNPLYYAKMPRIVAVKALTDVGKFAALAGTILALYKLNGAEVEDDARSSDYGKIKFGNTRYDVLGGYGQYIHLASELWNAQKKSTTTGKIQSLRGDKFPFQDRSDVTLKFLRYKASPAASIGMDMFTGKDAMGQPATLKNELYTHLTPLQLQTGIEAYQQGGLDKVVKTVLPSTFGIGAQTYNPKKKKTKENLRLSGFYGGKD